MILLLQSRLSPRVQSQYGERKMRVCQWQAEVIKIKIFWSKYRHGGVYVDKKTAVLNQIWLDYFNEYLYEEGFLTEQERNEMSNKISAFCNISILEPNDAEFEK